jgi:hypothetical protein
MIAEDRSPAKALEILDGPNPSVFQMVLPIWRQQVWSKIVEWLKYKSALPHSGMRNSELLIVLTELAVEQNIDVQGAGTPAHSALSVGLPLKRPTKGEQVLRRQICLERNHQIQIGPLVVWTAHRICLVEAAHLQLAEAHLTKTLNSPAQVCPSVAEV